MEFLYKYLELHKTIFWNYITGEYNLFVTEHGAA